MKETLSYFFFSCFYDCKIIISFSLRNMIQEKCTPYSHELETKTKSLAFILIKLGHGHEIIKLIFKCLSANQTLSVRQWMQMQ